jgi:hypothetical protein
MRKYQDIIVAKKLTARQTANFDETAFHPGAGPRYKYVTHDTQRASGNSDDKTRITAVIQANAAGEFAPTMFIMRHSKIHTALTTPDQTKMRVLKALHKMPGFRAKDGWELRTWSRELEMPDKDGVMVRQMHRKLFLKDTKNGHIVISQCKAWMDSSSMAVYLDEICRPIRDREGALLLWSDNCPSHCTQAIEDLYIEIDIDDAKYPKNCTDIVQPMDVSVNAGVKQHVRRNNAQAILNYLQQHHTKLAGEVNKPIEEQRMIKFRPPKPELHVAMQQFHELFKTTFATDTYKQSLAQTFVRTGSYFEDTEAMTFRPFSSVGNKVQGKLNIVPPNVLPADKIIEPHPAVQQPNDKTTPQDTEQHTDFNEQVGAALEDFLDDLEEGRLFMDSDDDDSESESDSDEESDF